MKRFFNFLFGTATLLASTLTFANGSVVAARHLLADLGSRTLKATLDTTAVRQDKVFVPAGIIKVMSTDKETQLTITLNNSDKTPFSFTTHIAHNDITSDSAFKLKMVASELALLSPKSHGSVEPASLVTVGSGACKQTKCEVKIETAGVAPYSLEFFSTDAEGVYFSNVSINNGVKQPMTLRADNI